jgi:hypothetical protein
MNLSYTTEYYPNLDELSQAQLDDARAFVVQKLREKFEDVDLSPGTVTGDQVVAPLSEFLAAADLAFSRFMSDLDMGNVAENVIYSCPFVEGFLGNFSVYDNSNLQSIGVVRLTFSADTAVTLTRNTAFKFNGDDEYRIRFTSANGEYFRILPTSTLPTTEDDKLVLTQTSEVTWAVDVPVFGAMTTEVPAGTTGTINKLPETLVGISAVFDFISGATSTSLSTLAKVARRIFHSMSASSRNGIRSTVYHNWPESVMVSPVVPTDVEMVRGAAGTAMSLPAPAVDVYYRSSRDLYTQVQLVKLIYTNAATHKGVADRQRFRGKLPFLHSPSKIRSITPVGVSGLVGGTRQVETATIVAAAGVTTAGNLSVTVTSPLITGSPLFISVPVAIADNASAVATKVRAALNATLDVTDHFTVGGTGAAYRLTANVKAADDATLNMGHANDTSVGVTTAATSETTTPGVAPSEAVVNINIYSRPTNVDIPYGMHFGTRYEEFYVDAEPALEDGLLPVIPLLDELNEDLTIAYKYAMFEVEYESDPLLNAVAAHLESPDQAAAGVSTVVHAGPLVDIDTMTIFYHRRAGVKMLLNPAAAKISEYAKNAGYPEVFTPAVIHDIMKIAGASHVASISVAGNVSPSPANRWFAFDAGFSITTNINDDWFRKSYAVSPTVITNLAGMSPNSFASTVVYDGNTFPANPQTMVVAMTARTVRYRIEEAGINFVELA